MPGPLPSRALSSLFRAWRFVAGARGGNVGLIVALAIPAVATLTLGATDVAAIMGDRAKMRSIAESAALSGARNLSVAMSESDSKAHALAMAESQIAEWPGAPEINVTVTITQLAQRAKGIRVALDARRPSFFGDLLPPGGWKYSDSATASSLGAKPLCVLAFSDSQKNKFTMNGSAEIRAPECLVHSNGDVEVKGGRIEAGQTQAVRSATGDITPTPITDAPRIEDPFKNLAIPGNGLCLKGGLNLEVGIYLKGNHTLPAGTHCGAITIGGDAVVTLAPGEHRFQLGLFLVGGNAKLVGDDVVLVFDTTSVFTFTGDARIDISGRKSGAHAGFVVMASRSNKLQFRIDSTHVDRLDGVIYIPNAELNVGGKSDVARESDWTVIVSDRLSMAGNPRLYLNTDYRGSDLNVPMGVGNRRDSVRLID